MPATAEGAWAPGPLRPLLAPGAVHVWRADLTAMGSEVRDVLSSDERARAERMRGDRDRQLWARSRGLLRVLIARYLQRDPRSLHFATGPHGKPTLAQEANGSGATHEHSSMRPARLSFNMSHSGAMALYAFSEMGAVGVDVEVARRPIDEVAVAARVFGLTESRRLGDLAPPIRAREFRRMWVRYEAQLKCLGVGIGGAENLAEAGEGIVRHTLWIAELDMGYSAAGAVAAEHHARELRCWGC